MTGFDVAAAAAFVLGVVWLVVWEIRGLRRRGRGDTISEGTRRVFRTRTSKLGRGVFIAAWFGFTFWFPAHILTELF